MINPNDRIEMRLRPHGMLLFVILVAWVGAVAVTNGLHAILSSSPFGNAHTIILAYSTWLVNVLITGVAILHIGRMMRSNAYVSSAQVYITEGGFGITRAWSLARSEIDYTVTRYSSRLARMFDIGTVELRAGDQSLTLRGLYHPQMLVDELMAVPEMAPVVGRKAHVPVPPLPEPSLSEAPVLLAQEVVPEVLKQPDSWQPPVSIETSIPSVKSSGISELVEGEAVYF